MRNHAFFGGLIGTLTLVGCISSSNQAPNGAVPGPEAAFTPLLQKQFVFDVVRHVYRWHFE
jgi:hypothetical protein